MEAGPSSSSPLGTSGNNDGTKKKKCKFGARCYRKNCKFVHPSTSAAAGPTNGGGENVDQNHFNSTQTDSGGMSDVSSTSNTVSPATAATKIHVKISSSAVNTNKQKKVNAVTPASKKIKKCRFGNDCRNIGTTCPFQHPSEARVTVVTPSPLPASRKGHHENAGITTGGASSVTSGSDDGTQTSKKNKSKKKSKRCRFGRNCKLSDCLFSHPGDVSEHSATHKVGQVQATQNSSTNPAASKSSPSEFLTVEELERALVASVTNAPNVVGTFAASQPQQHSLPSHSVQDNTMEYDDDGDYIEELLRQQEMERLELATATTGTPGLGSALPGNIYGQQQPHHDRRQVELQTAAVQQQQELRHASELEQTRERMAQLEKQLEIERQKRREAEEMAKKQPQPAQQFRQQQQHSKPQNSAKPRKQDTTQKQQVKAHSLPGSEGIQPQQLNQEDAAARRQRIEAESLKRKEGERKKQEEADLQKAVENERLEQQRLREQEEEELRLAMEASMEEEKARQASLEQYRAQRNAAKKERRRLEREAKEATSVAKKDAVPADKPSVKPAESFASVEESEQVAAATTDAASGPYKAGQSNQEDAKTPSVSPPKKVKESKAEKKRKKHEQRLIEMEKEAREREQFWESEIAKEENTIPKMVQLCIGEFCRTNSGYNRLEYAKNEDVMERMTPYCRESFRNLFDAELHTAVVIKGMGKKQQDMNERNGVILWWDKGRSKFEVEIDSKKGSRFTLLVPPSNLEFAEQNRKKRGKKSSRGGHGHTILIGDVCDGKGLLLDLDKQLIEKLVAAESTQVFVANFVQQQDYLEALEKENERKRQEDEENERRRRAERRRREQEEWEERQRQYQAQKAEFKARKKAHQQAQNRGQQYYEYDAEDCDDRCNCPSCMMREEFEHFLFSNIFGFGSMPGMGGARFSFRFTGDDSDEDDYFDQRFFDMHEEDLEAKLEAAAEELGVDVDASASDIKRVYRRKVLLYHPDKATARESEGLTLKECQEKFVNLQEAYDTLMNQFD